MNQQYIENYINDILSTDVDHISCMNVQVELEKCDVDINILTTDYEFQQRINTHNQEMNHYCIIHRKYRKKHRRWVKDIMRYKGRLQHLLKDACFREEFSMFLKTINMYNTFYECLHEDYYIDIDSIDADKYNKDTLLFWLILYKDSKIRELMSVKPKPPISNKRSNVEYSSIVTLHSLRERWLLANPKLEYYVLRIVCNRKKKCICKEDMWYMSFKNQWKCVKRCMKTDGSPATQRNNIHS